MPYVRDELDEGAGGFVGLIWTFEISTMNFLILNDLYTMRDLLERSDSNSSSE